MVSLIMYFKLKSIWIGVKRIKYYLFSTKYELEIKVDYDKRKETVLMYKITNKY